MRSVSRAIGAVLLFAALMFLLLDGTAVIAGTRAGMTPLGETLARWVGLPALNLMQAVVERYLHPVLWHSLLQPLLLVPAALIIALLGMFFWWLGRRVARIPLAIAPQRHIRS